MADIPPGREKPDATWGGTWFSIDRAEYDAIIFCAGGIEALSVAAAATRPDGDDYVYTAWGIKGQDIPLVASELRGCGPYEKLPSYDCRGEHTFWKFIPWPRYHCRICDETARRRPPRCGAADVHCEGCGEVMTPVCRHCDAEILRCTSGHQIPVCKGWKHVQFIDSMPIGAHYCEGRSTKPSAEPGEAAVPNAAG